MRTLRWVLIFALAVAGLSCSKSGADHAGASPGKASAAATMETATVPAADVVYITRTGKKYHRAGCSSLSKSKIPISRKDALARDYTPCSRCRPRA